MADIPVICKSSLTEINKMRPFRLEKISTRPLNCLLDISCLYHYYSNKFVKYLFPASHKTTLPDTIVPEVITKSRHGTQT